MWTKEQLKMVMRTKKFAVAVASATSLAAGFTAGHFWTKKLLADEYARLAQEEIETAKEYYQVRNKTGEYSDPSEVAKKRGYSDDPVEDVTVQENSESSMSPAPAQLKPGEDMEAFEQRIIDEAAEHVRKLKYHTASPEDISPKDQEKVEVAESIKKNIFDNTSPVEDDEDEFDIEFESSNRVADRPYILSHDEFFENEKDYSQNSLTYFEGDDVLTDEQDTPIRDVHGTIGADNLRFGYGSKDKNIVYIRNDRLSADFEVCRSFGTFTEEVLGFIEHADKVRPRKFRHED